MPHEVIVLDNASPDGSAAAIAEAFPELRLIASPENLGFAKGNNVAAREARGEYLLLLNPDTLVLDGALDKLVAFARRTPEAGIWGGRTLYADGSSTRGVFGDQTLWSLFCRATGLSVVFRGSPFFNPEDYGGWARDSEREVDMVQGSFLLIRRDALGRARRLRPELRDVRRGGRSLPPRARERRPAADHARGQIVHFAGASSRLRADKAILI